MPYFRVFCQIYEWNGQNLVIRQIDLVSKLDSDEDILEKLPEKHSIIGIISQEWPRLTSETAINHLFSGPTNP